ncbi:hypothetical protein TNCV_1701911 [Trichonephila clavipes]|nr:hypothetical protein TNCV_1701911 [Trichonephila clavipes]
MYRLIKYPKVMAYYYGTTHQNVTNCSSVDWKTLPEFWGPVRSARIVRQLDITSKYTDCISKDVDATAKDAVCILVNGI